MMIMMMMELKSKGKNPYTIYYFLNLEIFVLFFVYRFINTHVKTVPIFVALLINI